MTVQNGTIDGVTLLAGSPEGVTNTVSSVIYTRKAYRCSAHFPAYTGSTDTATVTGICTAIAAATRNGRSLTLVAVVPCSPGQDTASPPVTSHFTGTAVAAATLSNTTTTGDAAGQLSDSAGTETTSTTGVTSGLEFIAVVDES